MRKIFILLSMVVLLFFINCPQQQNSEPTTEEKAAATKSIAALNIAMNQANTTGQKERTQIGLSNPLLSVETYTINETLDATT